MRRISVIAFVLAVTGALALLDGCDRTRPLGGVAVESGSTAGSATDGPGSGGATSATPAAGPRKEAEGWRFSFSSPGAGSVALAGSFNDWSTSADPLVKGENVLWTIVKKLGPGTYQYKFVVNGTDWKADPNNPESTDDGYGGTNSVLQVP